MHNMEHEKEYQVISVEFKNIVEAPGNIETHEMFMKSDVLPFVTWTHMLHMWTDKTSQEQVTKLRNNFSCGHCPR